jgi:ATP-dependent exoDNAse (exonuclease V) beta subunit
MTDATSMHADDSVARRRAVDTSRSFIVRAPAGAGKTELLVQRFLALLAVVPAPEAVVAITFTVRAAGEMRARIVAALAGAAAGVAPDGEHGQRTHALALAALARDRARGWDLPDNPARLQIQTIDALCSRLAHRMPVLARLGAGLGATERPRPLYVAAARMLLDQIEDPRAGPHLARLLLHVDGDERALVGLVADMLAERDRWLRHVASEAGVQRAMLERDLRDTVADALGALAAATPDWLAAELPPLAAAAAAAVPADAESALRACAGLTAMPPPDVAALPQWLGLADLLLTDGGEPRRQLRAEQGFVPNGDAGLREAMLGVLRRLADEPAWVRRLAGVRRLPPPAYDDAQWEICDALLNVLPYAAACLRVTFAEAGAADFTEIAHAALRALGEPDAPTDLALALDQRIEHLLVDEFQDTSFTQLELLARLTAGWQPGDGRTLFLVGDPMQSIYRFREAEVALFERVERHGLGTLAPEPLALRRNFRAQAGLVDWVNATFARVFPAPGESDAHVPFTPALAPRPALEGVAVQIHAVAPDAEVARILAILADTRRERADATIAVLVRAREQLAPLVAALRANGISFRGVDIEPLAGAQVVQDLHALTRALLHLADRVAWLAVLRAPWCGLSLADLHALVRDHAEQTVWQAIVEERGRARLSDDGQRRLSRLKRVLADALAERGRHPLRCWIEGAWTALGGAACVRTAAEWANAQRYLRLLETLDAGGEPARLEEIDEALADLYADADPEGDERLQLMTIHRAKGLEFDTVIVPSLGRSPGRTPERLLTVLEQPRGTSSRLLVAPLGPGGEPDPVARYLRHVDACAEAEEATRLLYVAATRARERLHLLGSAGRSGRPRRDSLLARLWPVLADAFGEVPAPAEEARAAKAAPPRAPLRRLPSGWVPPGTPPPRLWPVPEPELPETPEFAWVSDVARHVGRAVHRALDRIGKDGRGRWDALGAREQEARLRGLLRELGTPAGQLDAATARAAAAIRNTLEDPRGQWLLEHAHADARSEHELSAWIDGRLVTGTLDRTFVDEHGVRWIVDFKTGVHEGGSVERFLDEEVERYRPQLERYARLMRRLDRRPLRVGIYFPLMRAWREWEP